MPMSISRHYNEGPQDREFPLPVFACCKQSQTGQWEGLKIGLPRKANSLSGSNHRLYVAIRKIAHEGPPTYVHLQVETQTV